MIDKETLKKHNLKAVPFSCVGEGQTFNSWQDFHCLQEHTYYTRLRNGDFISYANGHAMFAQELTANKPHNMIVYVPIWRPCRKPHLMEAWGYAPIPL